MFTYYGYKIRHAMFKWVTDNDGDVGLQIFGVLTIIKYKEHAIFEWFKRYPDAGRYQGRQDNNQEFQSTYISLLNRT